MVYLPLVIAFALGVTALVFRKALASRGVGLGVAIGAMGSVLLIGAVLTLAHAMNIACHGEYRFLRSPFACTPPP